jgi:hypothetical protein
MCSIRLVLVVGLVVALLSAASSSAQQMTLTSPFQNNSSSFFERNAIGWSGNYRGMNFSFGQPALANPQFGGYQPGSNPGLSTNFAIVGKHGQVNFNMDFGQGARMNSVTQAPSVTLMNGQQAFFSDTSQTPFVISMLPVVGSSYPGFGFNPWASLPAADPMMPQWANPRVQAMRQARADAAAADGDAEVAPAPRAPAPRAAGAKGGMRDVAPEPVAAPGGAGKLAAAQASSAGRAAPSVAEARRLHEQERAAAKADVQALFERGQAAEDDGKPGVAKIYYQRVIRDADGELKAQAQERLDALMGSKP